MRIVVALVALVFAAAGLPAQGPADLFPAGTLAYAEVRGPALADGVAALVKGTPWADSLAAVPELLDRARNPVDEGEARETAAFALGTAPETLAELRRTRGAAVGLLGYSAKGRPRYAGVLLTGDSGVAGLAGRKFLTTDPTLRRVTSLDGVAVFQYRGPTHSVGETPPGPVAPVKPFPPGDEEPTFATVPGLFVVGSDVDAVRDAVSRFKQAGKPPSLAGVPAFKAAHGSPAAGTVGSFYATPAAYLAASDRARSPGTSDPLGVARFLFDGPRWTTVTGHLTLSDDRVELSLAADYEKLPPLAEALTGPALPPDDQARVRRPYLSDVGLTVPPGADRAGRWLTLADAVAAGRGHLGRKPSQLVADLDRASKTTTARDLFGTVAGISVGYSIDGPVAVAHLDGSPLAGRWSQELPRLLPEILGQSGSVSSELAAGGARVFALQWGDEAARSRLTVAVTPQAIYAAADPSRVGLMQMPPPAAAAALPKSRGVVQVPIALFRLNLLSPPAAPADVPVMPVAPFGPNGQVLLDAGPPPARPAGPPAPDVFDLLMRRLRPLPMLSVDAALTPASPNRVTLTVRLPDAKAAVRRLFEMPKPVAPPADAPAKEPEEPVAPARRRG
jgi:hypothetical protein